MEAFLLLAAIPVLWVMLAVWPESLTAEVDR